MGAVRALQSAVPLAQPGGAVVQPPFWRRPKYQIPDDKVLAAVREAKGNILVAGNDPIHFVLNAEGLYQNLSSPRF